MPIATKRDWTGMMIGDTWTFFSLCDVTYAQPVHVYCRGGSRTAATSRMEHFVIITKSSILAVAAVLDSPLYCFTSAVAFLGPIIVWHMLTSLNFAPSNKQYFSTYHSDEE